MVSQHPIPQALREHLSQIEDEAGKHSAYSMFTRMRTAVQAYFAGIQDSTGPVQRAEYWKQRARSAEGHLFASDCHAAAKVLQRYTVAADTAWDDLSDAERARLGSAACAVIAAVNARRAERLPRDSREPLAGTVSVSAAAPLRIPAGFYRELIVLRELRDSIKLYADRYMRDEIDSEEACVNPEQHDSAATVASLLDDAFTAQWSAAVEPPGARMVGSICGGDSELNTVNIKLAQPADWPGLRLGSQVELAVTKPYQEEGEPCLAK